MELNVYLNTLEKAWPLAPGGQKIIELLLFFEGGKGV